MREENTFRALFTRAQYALPADLVPVVALRYGYPDGSPHTLEEIGRELGGLTQERIRQLLYRALIIMRCTALRQIGQDETTGGCARLLLYLREVLAPDAAGASERIVAFAREEVPELPPQKYGLPLLVTLLYGRGKQAKSLLADLLQLDREVLSAEVQERLRAVLQLSPPDGGMWNSRKVQAWVYEQTGIEINQRQGLDYLIRMNCPSRQRRSPQPASSPLAALAGTSG
jgi:hypothetical protein